MKIVKMFSIFFFCVLFLTSCDRKPQSHIMPIDSLCQIQETFNSADDKTLIVFDVDETLIMPGDAIWQQGRIWEGDVTKHFPLPDQIKNMYKDIQANNLEEISERMLHVEFKPVEKNTISSVRSLQQRNLKIIALTNFGPGSFGHIPSLREWRQSQLCEIGIDFESSFPGLALQFNNLPAHQSGHPEFYKGILFGANNPKGIVLGAFLDQIPFKPTKIIIIDDKEKYLLSVQDELAKRSIAFQGFLYKGAEKEAAPINLAVIEYQLAQWQREHQYISDVQACIKFNDQAISA